MGRLFELGNLIKAGDITWCTSVTEELRSVEEFVLVNGTAVVFPVVWLLCNELFGISVDSLSEMVDTVFTVCCGCTYIAFAWEVGYIFSCRYSVFSVFTWSLNWVSDCDFCWLVVPLIPGFLSVCTPFWEVAGAKLDPASTVSPPLVAPISPLWRFSSFTIACDLFNTCWTISLSFCNNAVLVALSSSPGLDLSPPLFRMPFVKESFIDWFFISFSTTEELDVPPTGSEWRFSLSLLDAVSFRFLFNATPDA